MADKFLNTGSGNSNLSDGTTPIYIESVTVAGLTPSMPIKTNSVNKLISSNLEIADINNLQTELDNVITNPFIGNLNVSDLETDDYASLNTELDKITSIQTKTQNQTAVPSLTSFVGDLSTSSQGSVNTTLDYVTNFDWLSGINTSISGGGSSITVTHGNYASNMRTRKLYPVRNMRTTISCKLPSLSGLPNIISTENSIIIGNEFGYGARLFNDLGVSKLYFLYYTTFNPTMFQFAAGDILKITNDGEFVYYSIKGTFNTTFIQPYLSNYPNLGNIKVGFSDSSVISPTNNTYTISDIVISQESLQSYNLIPYTDNLYDIGSATKKIKDLYINGVANFGGVILTGTINSLSILPVTTNTSNVGSSTFPYLTMESTTKNTKNLTIWNSARTFNHNITSLATTTQNYTLPATQSNGLFVNTAGALTWATNLGSLALTTTGALTTTNQTVNGIITLGASASLAMGARPITSTGTMTMGTVTLSNTLNSLNILPTVTNTNGVGSSTFPYLTMESTTKNTKNLTIWNSARTFNHTITSLASANQAYTLPATQPVLPSLLENNGSGALSWNTKTLGSLWVHGNTLNTTMGVISTYVSLNVTTWNTGSLVNFSRVNGVLTYNGTVTKTFLVSYSGYFVNNTAGIVPLFQILGGAGRGFCSQSCPTVGALYQFSSTNIFTIAPGATIEIQVQASPVAGGVIGNINVFSLFFNAVQID
jgi:hypothetical protein